MNTKKKVLCPLCGGTTSSYEAIIDHDHSTDHTVYACTSGCKGFTNDDALAKEALADAHLPYIFYFDPGTGVLKPLEHDVRETCS
jgi:hypothetical protein